jgi:hypothetical protein
VFAHEPEPEGDGAGEGTGSGTLREGETRVARMGEVRVEVGKTALRAHASSSGSSSTNDSNNSHSSESSDHNSDLESTTGQSSSESGSSESMETQILIVDYYEMLEALEDEVAKARVLHRYPPSTHISQLRLLDEWRLDHPELYRRKLRVSQEVFAEILELIKDHPIFHNNSTKPQLPVQIQLAIFSMQLDTMVMLLQHRIWQSGQVSPKALFTTAISE